MKRHYSLNEYIYDGAAIVLKDLLRGIRHISLYTRSIGLRVLSKFPSFIRTPTNLVVNRVDHFAERVERKTASVVHSWLDPEIARDADHATFTKILMRDDAPIIFAMTSYNNLKRIVEYLSERDGIDKVYFISEMLSACSYRRASATFEGSFSHMEKAGLVLHQLLEQGAIRTNRSLNAFKSSDETTAKLARTACFAHLLWLVIARDYSPDKEDHLLHACCDLASVIDEQIQEAQADPSLLGELLKIHAEIV